MREGVEHYSQIRAIQAAERSDVALVVADATEGLTEADLSAVDRAAARPLRHAPRDEQVGPGAARPGARARPAARQVAPAPAHRGVLGGDGGGPPPPAAGGAAPRGALPLAGVHPRAQRGSSASWPTSARGRGRATAACRCATSSRPGRRPPTLPARGQRPLADDARLRVLAREQAAPALRHGRGARWSSRCAREAEPGRSCRGGIRPRNEDGPFPPEPSLYGCAGGIRGGPLVLSVTRPPHSRRSPGWSHRKPASRGATPTHRPRRGGRRGLRDRRRRMWRQLVVHGIRAGEVAAFRAVDQSGLLRDHDRPRGPAVVAGGRSSRRSSRGTRSFEKMIDESLQGDGVNFETDVKPLLGDRAAIAALNVPNVSGITSTDAAGAAGAAENALSDTGRRRGGHRRRQGRRRHGPGGQGRARRRASTTA